jgi:hypothetical protein
MAGLQRISDAMKRQDLEHLIRAAGAIARTRELVIIGSQAILAMYPDAPDELLVSQEADLYPPDDPGKADLIDGSIGELSPFHEQFGYYAHGVGPETAVLPKDWRRRSIKIQNANTGGIAGICPHPADLAASKLVAGRERDLDYVRALLKYGLVTAEQIQSSISELPGQYSSQVTTRLRSLCEKGSQS